MTEIPPDGWPGAKTNDLFYDPNTKRFKRTLIYFNTDTQYAKMFGEIPFIKQP